jgi:hypothetical protein
MPLPEAVTELRHALMKAHAIAVANYDITTHDYSTHSDAEELI